MKQRLTDAQLREIERLATERLGGKTRPLVLALLSEVREHRESEKERAALGEHANAWAHRRLMTALETRLDVADAARRAAVRVCRDGSAALAPALAALAAELEKP